MPASKLVAAHRGDHSRAHENTIEAMQAAITLVKHYLREDSILGVITDVPAEALRLRNEEANKVA